MKLSAFILVTSLAALAHGQTPHTPKPGSPERQAICDGARAFVVSKYAQGNLPQPIVFRIDRLAVVEGYADMEAIPLFKDGSYVDGRYLPDIGYHFCLERTGTAWRVIADLSRSDVPDAAECRGLRARLPADFPLTLFSSEWQSCLRSTR